MSATASSADQKLTGLVAATFAPFTTEGELNLSVIGPYIDYLKDKQGVKSIFVNGSTGEGMSLSVEERKTLAQEWCQKAKGKMDHVIVHVGCMSLKDSQELARHAVTIKADAIAVISPSYYKPSNADVLRSYLQEVASVAPTLPFYYYHLPAVTGVNVPVRDLLVGIKERIPSFRGVKFSGTDLMDFGQCVSQSHSDWSFLYGVDEQLLAALALGADGAVGSTYNYMGCQVNKLISEFGKGNLVEARKIQFKVQDLISFAIQRGVDLGMFKQLMIELSGLSLGPPRLPVKTCPPADVTPIVEKYRSVFPEECPGQTGL
ncbi:N-acetylneuraminate lyase [Plectropomus leopardus]|uniref:N-acetylneuraminate lyase n=1 Tax=Plectropomus leopardus TaxID=160734 RepID=UPI001C4A79B0|nr:N-acetylneuraminate lyase [Plectropomus leopardus]